MQRTLPPRDPIRLGRIPSPLGPMVAGAVDGRVCLLEFADRRMLETQLRRLMERLRRTVVRGPSETLVELERALAVYFAGRPIRLDLELSLPGTPFQRRVWTRLLETPYGETITYRDLARAVGRPGAARAAGGATGDNRLAILVPCHRVVGSDGRLTGYGGGLWRKRWLLDHERATSEGPVDHPADVRHVPATIRSSPGP